MEGVNQGPTDRMLFMQTSHINRQILQESMLHVLSVQYDSTVAALGLFTCKAQDIKGLFTCRAQRINSPLNAAVLLEGSLMLSARVGQKSLIALQQFSAI